MTQQEQRQEGKGQFVQFPVHLIYGIPDLSRDDKWVLLSIMGRYWGSGPHRLSYREIAALSGVPISLLSSFIDKKAGKPHEGILERIVRVTGYLRLELRKAINPLTGQPCKQAQTYISIDYARIWQDNLAYCEKRKSVAYTNTSYDESVPYVNSSVSYTNATVPTTNGSVSVSRSEMPPIDYIDYEDITDSQEEGKGDAAIADHPPAAPAQSLQWENFSAFDEGLSPEAENDTSSHLSTSSVDKSEKGQNDALVAPVVPVAVPDRLPDCGADVPKTDVRGDDHANVVDSPAVCPMHVAAHAGPGESSESESIADTHLQATAVDSLSLPDPVAASHRTDVVSPLAGASHPATSEMPPRRGGRARKSPKEKPAKPERPPKPAKPVDIPLEATLSEDEMLLYREWCSLFHVPVKLTASMARAAKFLAEPLTIWAGLLGVDRREVLRGYKGWEFQCNNRNGFFSRKGVQLYDLERDFEAWQSAMQHQLDEAARGPESPPEKVIAFSSKPTRHISSFDDPDYDMSDEFYPAHPEPVAVQG